MFFPVHFPPFECRHSRDLTAIATSSSETDMIEARVILSGIRLFGFSFWIIMIPYFVFTTRMASTMKFSSMDSSSKKTRLAACGEARQREFPQRPPRREYSFGDFAGLHCPYPTPTRHFCTDLFSKKKAATGFVSAVKGKPARCLSTPGIQWRPNMSCDPFLSCGPHAADTSF